MGGTGVRVAPRGPARRDELPAGVQHVLRTPGRPLEPDVRTTMEAHLLHDFTSVRVHTDDRAAATARDVAARAYTVGDHIVFRPGGYAPHTTAGRRSLAHELAHVVQQRRGGAPAPGENAGHALERAADHAADRVAASHPAAVTGASGPGLARQEDEEQVRLDEKAAAAYRESLKIRSTPVDPGLAQVLAGTGLIHRPNEEAGLQVWTQLAEGGVTPPDSARLKTENRDNLTRMSRRQRWLQQPRTEEQLAAVAGSDVLRGHAQLAAQAATPAALEAAKQQLARTEPGPAGDLERVEYQHDVASVGDRRLEHYTPLPPEVSTVVHRALRLPPDRYVSQDALDRLSYRIANDRLGLMAETGLTERDIIAMDLFFRRTERVSSRVDPDPFVAAEGFMGRARTYAELLEAQRSSRFGGTISGAFAGAAVAVTDNESVIDFAAGFGSAVAIGAPILAGWQSLAPRRAGTPGPRTPVPPLPAAPSRAAHSRAAPSHAGPPVASGVIARPPGPLRADDLPLFRNLLMMPPANSNRPFREAQVLQLPRLEAMLQASGDSVRGPVSIAGSRPGQVLSMGGRRGGGPPTVRRPTPGTGSGLAGRSAGPSPSIGSRLRGTMLGITLRRASEGVELEVPPGSLGGPLMSVGIPAVASPRTPASLSVPLTVTPSVTTPLSITPPPRWAAPHSPMRPFTDWTPSLWAVPSRTDQTNVARPPTPRILAAQRQQEQSRSARVAAGTMSVTAREDARAAEVGVRGAEEFAAEAKLIARDRDVAAELLREARARLSVARAALRTHTVAEAIAVGEEVEAARAHSRITKLEDEVEWLSARWYAEQALLPNPPPPRREARAAEYYRLADRIEKVHAEINNEVRALGRGINTQANAAAPGAAYRPDALANAVWLGGHHAVIKPTAKGEPIDVTTGLPIKIGSWHVDHLMPRAEIRENLLYRQLSPAQRERVLLDVPENYLPLTGSANGQKGDMSVEEWIRYRKRIGQPLPPGMADALLQADRRARDAVAAAIWNEWVKLQSR